MTLKIRRRRKHHHDKCRRRRKHHHVKCHRRKVFMLHTIPNEIPTKRFCFYHPKYIKRARCKNIHRSLVNFPELNRHRSVLPKFVFIQLHCLLLGLLYVYIKLNL